MHNQKHVLQVQHFTTLKANLIKILTPSMCQLVKLNKEQAASCRLNLTLCYMDICKATLTGDYYSEALSAWQAREKKGLNTSKGVRWSSLKELNSEVTEESHSEVQPVCALKHIAVRVHLNRELPYPIMQRTQSAGNEPELHQNHDSLYKYLNKFYSASPKYYIKHIGWLERVLKFINHEEGIYMHSVGVHKQNFVALNDFLVHKQNI